MKNNFFDMYKKTNYLLIVIVIIAAVIRLLKLGETPPSLNWDEVALGYNAYSIVQTGKDEYGSSFPFILRSYDDFKPAFYIYFVAPFVYIFGLDAFSVRLPSAIFGTLAVMATYFLVKVLLSYFNGFKDHRILNSKNIALTSSLLLALSPWHIQFSRIAFESNLGLSLNIFFVLFLLLSLTRPFFFIVSCIFVASNPYMYQSDKVFTPLLFIFLLFIVRKQLIRFPKKVLILGIFTVIVILLPMVFYTLTNKQALARAQGVSVFSDTTSLLERNANRLIIDREKKNYLGYFLDNRRVVFVISVISGYISHFDLNWLFITGDLARHHAPGMGLLYLFELPFLLVGIYILVWGNFNKKIKIILLGWFLLAPVPASITTGVPHAVRTLNFLPMFQIFTALGLLTTIASISKIKHEIVKIRIKYLIFSLFFLFFIFNFL